jgi:hypothetical protein
MGKYYEFPKFTDEEFCNYVNNNSVFVSRIGGSDYNAIYQYQLYKNGKNSGFNFELFNNICSNYNGYFDKDDNKEKRYENFIKYLDLLYEIYKKQKITFVMLDIYNIEKCTFHSNLEIFNENVLYNRKLISYGFVEHMTGFLNNFELLTKNKKVLFISPFSESIKYQYNRKDKLLNNYILPDFELLTYDTPITYNNQDTNISNTKTNNWFEQCELMANEISNIDFDIAFLSCGSYALYLGDFIAEKLHKTSFYLGGVLNVIFNIAADRYNNCEFYKKYMNYSTQIIALEQQKYINMSAGKNIKSEGLNAYFSMNKELEHLEILNEKIQQPIEVENIIIQFYNDKNLEKIQDEYYNKILNTNKNVIVTFKIPEKLIKTKVFTFYKCWRNGYCLNSSTTKIPKNIINVLFIKN